MIATLTLNGDYLSDALAAQVSGMRTAPGGNVNYITGHVISKATHGTAPALPPSLLNREVGDRRAHRANSTLRTSRISVIFTSPGYCRSDSTFLAMSRAILALIRSSTSLASTMTRTSRPAWMA